MPPETKKHASTECIAAVRIDASGEIEALIERLNRNSDAIMRGRTFDEDSADAVREMRVERTDQLMGIPSVDYAY
jgi:hypothetical protein